jgi:hypothetical protein
MANDLAAIIEELDDGTDHAARGIADEIITRHPDLARELLYPVIRSEIIKDRRRKARIISDPAITPGAVADTMQERRELLRGWSGL